MSLNISRQGKNMKTFDERCREEGTRDVVFLLQVPDWVYTGFPYSSDGEYFHDGEGVILGDVDEKNCLHPREDAEYLTDEQMEDMDNIDGVPCAIQKWRTVGVYLTREEAEDFAKRHEYRGDFRKGWNVYGICASEELAKAIRIAEGVGVTSGRLADT
jgi:hypothetical protein